MAIFQKKPRIKESRSGREVQCPAFCGQLLAGVHLSSNLALGPAARHHLLLPLPSRWGCMTIETRFETLGSLATWGLGV